MYSTARSACCWVIRAFTIASSSKICRYAISLAVSGVGVAAGAGGREDGRASANDDAPAGIDSGAGTAGDRPAAVRTNVALSAPIIVGEAPASPRPSPRTPSWAAVSCGDGEATMNGAFDDEANVPSPGGDGRATGCPTTVPVEPGGDDSAVACTGACEDGAERGTCSKCCCCGCCCCNCCKSCCCWSCCCCLESGCGCGCGWSG